MTPRSPVSEFFATDGVLARTLTGFAPRESQRLMAEAVAETIASASQLIVEAGTGTGKTFAYLVPALASGKRVIISTGTKALQEQLYNRDLPALLAAMDYQQPVALLKGRSSYLCIHRMEHARHHPQASQPVWQRALSRVEQWAQVTRTGDMAELPGLDETSGLWPLVTSTRDNCLGSNCPRYKACHVNLARKEAMAADVVVINHHLFFADLAVRESGVAELLPTVRVTVFDEAHQLNEIGVHFLGQELSTVQLLELARDVEATGLTLARGLVDWPALSQGLETAARDWRLVAARPRGSVRLRWLHDAPQSIDPQQWGGALKTLALRLEALSAGLDQVTELAPDFQRLLERARHLQQLCQRFGEPVSDDGVRWVEVSSALRVVQAPLDVAETFVRLTAVPASQVQENGEPVPQPPSRAWIFTSATLGDDPALRWFTGPCGLDSARTLRVDSPFDYAAQAALHVPLMRAQPGEDGHATEVAELVLGAARRLGGRTLVLTTTLASMRVIAEHLQTRVESAEFLEVLVQGQSPKRVLMDRFREGNAHGQSGCILVASASFWEGFDVPGDALQLVVIDKLPFAPPDDPVFEARGLRLQQQGRSVFTDLALPQAAVMLKQGGGRLIRSENDRGILVVCDPRLMQKGYGRRLRAALPPMRLLKDHKDFEQALTDLVTNASPELPPGL